MNRLVGGSWIIRLLARPLAVVAIWLTATAFFGLAYYLSGRRVRVEDAIIFTVAFANASAVSGVIALAIGARKRWALEAALPMMIFIATPVCTASVLNWLAPTLSANLGGVDYLPAKYRGHLPTAVLGIARMTIPTGVILGVGLGFTVGALILLARSRLRLLVRWVVAGLLLACVLGSVHVVAFDRVVDFVVMTRLNGLDRFHANWTMHVELASAIGATAGAFVGAVVAYGASGLSNRSRGSHRLRGHGHAEH
jgi:hypothetical protein